MRPDCNSDYNLGRDDDGDSLRGPRPENSPPIRPFVGQQLKRGVLDDNYSGQHEIRTGSNALASEVWCSGAGPAMMSVGDSPFRGFTHGFTHGRCSGRDVR